MLNPFVTSGYAGEEYFCDRVDETHKLVSFLTNENNVALISPRRIGKTELIRHCFSQREIKDKYYTFVIDIYATNSIRDFVNIFGKTILNTLRSRGRKVWESFLSVLSSLRSEITFDIDGRPTWSIGMGAITNPMITLDEIFRYLDKADKPCIVAIDEFQQITRYNDNNIEALLRTYIQKCTNAHFIFSGSRRTLMGEMFQSPSRPFYQSVILFNLSTIPLEKYREFAVHHFESNDKHLDSDVVEELYDRFNGITYYLQRVMNYMYMFTPKGGRASKDSVDTMINEILSDSHDTYQNLFMQVPEKQRMVLLAIAKEDRVTSVSSGAFVRKYHLQSASTVLSAVKGLLERDLITREGNIYMVYDILFRLWMLREMQ